MPERRHCYTGNYARKMANRGYIKLFRSIEDWEWYKDGNTLRLFLHLLITASNEGQLVTSLSSLAAALGMSVQNVRTSLGKLKSTNKLTSKSTNKLTCITICRFEDYQDSQQADQQANQQANQQAKEENFPQTPLKEEKYFLKEKDSLKRVEKETSSSPIQQELKPSPQPPSLENRRSKFYDSLVPYVGKYPKEMIRDFYDYWSETDRGVKPKMRFEKQTSWELSKRLARWERNNRPRGVAPAHATSRLDQYKEIARQIGIYQDGTEQSDTVDEQ